jgi:hypothetical protein
MDRPLTWIDRLRIERVVWLLDQRLYDIPRESRIAHRRDVRQNLLAAASDVGTGAALRNLGSSAQLAARISPASSAIALATPGSRPSCGRRHRCSS